MKAQSVSHDRKNGISSDRRRNKNRKAKPTHSIKRYENTDVISHMNLLELVIAFGESIIEDDVGDVYSQILLIYVIIEYARPRFDETAGFDRTHLALVGRPTLEMAVGSLQTKRGKLGHTAHMVVYRGEPVDMRSPVGSVFVTKEDFREPFVIFDPDMHLALGSRIPKSFWCGSVLHKVREVSCRCGHDLVRLLETGPRSLECILFLDWTRDPPQAQRRRIVAAMNRLPALQKIDGVRRWLRVAECRHLTSLLLNGDLDALPGSLTKLKCRTVTAPVEEMTRLTSLDVRTAPACLGQLTQLRHLRVRRPNSISDAVRLPNLEDLSLRRTDEKAARLLLAGCFGTSLRKLNLGSWHVPLPGLGRLFPLLHSLEWSTGDRLRESMPLPPLRSLKVPQVDDDLLEAFAEGVLPSVEHVESTCEDDDIRRLLQVTSVTSLKGRPISGDWYQVEQATHLQQLELTTHRCVPLNAGQQIYVARIAGAHPSLCKINVVADGETLSYWSDSFALLSLRANPRISLPLIDRWAMKDRTTSTRAFLLVNRRLARRNSPWLTMDILRNCIYPLLMSLPVDVSEMTWW